MKSKIKSIIWQSKNKLETQKHKQAADLEQNIDQEKQDKHPTSEELSLSKIFRRFRITPDDIMAFILLTTATYAVTWLILQARAFNGIIKGLPEGVGLVLSATDIYFSKYESFFKLDYAYFGLAISFVLAALFRALKFDISKTDTIKWPTACAIIITVALIHYFKTNWIAYPIVLFILFFCYWASQLPSHFLSAVALVNSILLLPLTLYITTPKHDEDSNDSSISNYTHIEIDTNGTYKDYILISDTKKGKLVQDSTNSTLLIPENQIRSYRFIK